ncbi:MAG: hypothetical protein Q4F05_19705 [bacterium]|nr:hypothetical protein [bacterium]
MSSKLINLGVREPIPGNEVMGMVITAGVLIVVLAIVTIYRTKHNK